MYTNKLFIDDYKDKSCFIVKFTASWCVPCQRIQPVFEKLCQDYGVCEKVVDVETNDESEKNFVESIGIRCLPTFIAYRFGEQVDICEGSDCEKLKTLVENLLNNTCMHNSLQKEINKDEEKSQA